MSKKEASFPKQLTRRPLRNEPKVNEESSEEESEEPVDPSVKEELHSSEHIKKGIKQNLTNTSEKKQTVETRQKKIDTSKRKYGVDKLPNMLPHLSANYRNLIYPFCIGMLVLLGCACAYYLDFSQKKPEVQNSLSQVLEGLKNHFKKQTSLTHHILKLQLQKVVNINYEPAAPAILTLIADKGAESTASQISKYLGKALAHENYISVNDSSYWYGNPHDIKEKIDEEITSKYLEDALNVIIIDKLQKIPFEAAMIFHSYCDHENSPFKRAVFLFILPLDEIIPENTTSKYLDTVAMNSLRNVWDKATDDEVDSLITRIAVSVVNIK